MQNFLGVEAPLIFDIILHLATLFVILIFFRRDILEIAKDFQLVKFIVVGSIPIAILGFFFSSFFESLFLSPLAVAVALLINGTILFLTKFRNDKKPLNVKNSFLIGIAQAFAIIPGLSRSGLTISTGILSGIDKEKVIKFSFLLYIPAVIGAFFFKLSELATISQSMLYPTMAGFFAAFFVGYISLKLLIKLILEKKFYFFAFYCWILGLTILISL